MNARNLIGLAVVSLTCTLFALAQTQPPTRGPAEGGSPAWFLQGSFPDPTGNTIVAAAGLVTVPPRGGGAARPVTPSPTAAPAIPRTPPCSRSPLCANRLTPGRQSLQR